MIERYDAVLLAGGSGRRLGGVDKALLEVGGEVLLARVLAAVAGADRTVCVGPTRATATPVIWCREDPPGGGPVAALAAASPYLRSDIVVVLAVDLPFVDRHTVTSLLAALDNGRTWDGPQAAVGLDDDDRAQPLLAAYRRGALQARLAEIGEPAGARVRDLVSPLRRCEVRVGAAATDCDTADDLAAARAVAERSARVSTLDDWMQVLADDLGVQVEVDIKTLLDLARDAAHGVDRPAAPLTTFLVGYAAAEAGGGRTAITAAVERAAALAQSWSEQHPAAERRVDQPPTDQDEQSP